MTLRLSQPVQGDFDDLFSCPLRQVFLL